MNGEWVNSVPAIVTKVALKKAGEAKEMKEALLCDTLIAFTMIHQHKTELTDYEGAVR